jgi:hypothetical protein
MTAPNTNPSPLIQPAPLTQNGRKIAPWALLPVVLLGALISGLLFMLHVAVDDPHFALEPQYYEQALRWDQARAQQATNERLAWKAQWQLERVASQPGAVSLRVRLTASDGEPLRDAVARVVAFHNAFAADRRTAQLLEEAEASYLATLEDMRPGLWEFRLEVQRGAEHFTQMERLELSP